MLVVFDYILPMDPSDYYFTQVDPNSHSIVKN